MRRILLSAVLMALCAAPAFSHGGQFKGPSDAGPGGSSGGGAVAPPTNPGGAQAPGPGAPSSGGGALSGAGTGGGNKRGESARKAKTGGAQIELGRGFEIWEFWWENNKDRFLNLKERLVKTTSSSGSVGALSGRGRKSDSSSSRRPTVETVNNTVIPLLEGLLASEDNTDIIDSSILALGRVAREDMATSVIDIAMPLLQHNELSVQSSATIAVGVLGNNNAVGTLTALMTDSSAGRRASGGGEVPQLVRAFAALGLGLIDDPTSVQSLIDIVDNLPDAERDIKVCAIVAMGLMTNESRGDAFQFLVDKLGDRKLDAVIKSYIPTTLGKLGMPEALDPVLESFTDRDSDNFVRQSAAIALGRLADMSDTAVIEGLKDYIKEGRDMQTRHFCFISLGKIAARDSEMQDVKAHEALEKLFHDEILKPSRQSNSSWAALSGALYARGHDDTQPEMIERLKKAYKDESDPSFKAAFALSLGLLQSKEMAPQIFEDFLDSKDNDFRGYAAVALGLTNHTAAADTLRGLCQNKTIPPTFRLQVATALGLMSDDQAIQVLVSTLDGARTLGVSSAVAKALGLIGDTNAVGALAEIAKDDKKNDLTRAFACVALGIVCEVSDLPWNARISEDNNYRARVPAIDEVLDIL